MLAYWLALKFYWIAASIASLFNPKAKAFIKGRKGVFDSIKQFKKEHKEKVIWFHTASLGEFELAVPLMQAIKSKHPKLLIAVSFFSPSGYERRKQHELLDFACYLPMDSRKKAIKFLDLLRPEKAFFIKYEYWFHYLNEAQKLKIDTYNVSARFTPKHIHFKWYGGSQRKILKLFTHIYVQNQASLDLLQKIGVKQASVSGDMRFDRVLQTISNPTSFPEIELFCKESKTLIIGSAWESDIVHLKHFINQDYDDLKVIIAPHEIDQGHIEAITKHITVSYDIYTESFENGFSSQVLILDTIGMLSNVYQYGDFSFIGGAFGSSGLSNILEAVAFGLPVVFGNKGLDKFPESERLSDLGGAFIVSDKNSTTQALNQLYLDDEFRTLASRICTQFVRDNAGTTDLIMNQLNFEA